MVLAARVGCGQVLLLLNVVVGTYCIFDFGGCCCWGFAVFCGGRSFQRCPRFPRRLCITVSLHCSSSGMMGTLRKSGRIPNKRKSNQGSTILLSLLLSSIPIITGQQHGQCRIGPMNTLKISLRMRILQVPSSTTTSSSGGSRTGSPPMRDPPTTSPLPLFLFRLCKPADQDTIAVDVPYPRCFGGARSYLQCRPVVSVVGREG
mmetsp:Transcript_18700/g.34436  ORF Transcript_18700/g.34436 Transcript_18700/m.34436 type:complete len:204 (-) Transcript_18700:212-823(-)